MSLSAKTQYACLAMLQLAADYEVQEPSPLRRIAEQHGIPAAFLVQILQELKRAGLVGSSRGSAGGYRLANSPDQITLADVVAVFECLDAGGQCAAVESPLAQTIGGVCEQLASMRREWLESVTLSELAAAGNVQPMWYI
ncbi:MAG: Rrf2 family transcriptional regulator [Planctomycetales bacterium]|nr:Rrf2 family transcriptional regulator [Planctomycetales bacterium]